MSMCVGVVEFGADRKNTPWRRRTAPSRAGSARSDVLEQRVEELLVGGHAVDRQHHPAAVGLDRADHLAGREVGLRHLAAGHDVADRAEVVLDAFGRQRVGQLGERLELGQRMALELMADREGGAPEVLLDGGGVELDERSGVSRHRTT